MRVLPVTAVLIAASTATEKSRVELLHAGHAIKACTCQ
jgi:hypothetical protein